MLDSLAEQLPEDALRACRTGARRRPRKAAARSGPLPCRRLPSSTIEHAAAEGRAAMAAQDSRCRRLSTNSLHEVVGEHRVHVRSFSELEPARAFLSSRGDASASNRNPRDRVRGDHQRRQRTRRRRRRPRRLHAAVAGQLEERPRVAVARDGVFPHDPRALPNLRGRWCTMPATSCPVPLTRRADVALEHAAGSGRRSSQVDRPRRRIACRWPCRCSALDRAPGARWPPSTRALVAGPGVDDLLLAKPLARPRALSATSELRLIRRGPSPSLISVPRPEQLLPPHRAGASRPPSMARWRRCSSRSSSAEAIRGSHHVPGHANGQQPSRKMTNRPEGQP